MDRKKLLAQLNKALPAAGLTAVMEEAKCFRFRGNSLTTANGTEAVRVTLDGDAGIDGLVPAEKFCKLVAGLEAPDLDIKQDGGELRLKCGGSAAKYKIRPGEGGFLDEIQFSIPQEAWMPWPVGMSKALRLCRFAASRDAAAGPMCGINVDAAGVRATDRYRIAEAKVDGIELGEPVTLSMDLIDLLAKQPAEPSLWAVVGETAYFDVAGAIVMGQLIGTAYPAVGQFLDQARAGQTPTVTLPESVRAAVKRHDDQLADINELDRRVTVKLAGKQIVVTSTDGVVYQLDEHLDAPEPLPNTAFSVNPAFMAEVLGLTRQIQLDPATGFITFRADGFIYLTTIEWEGQKSAQAASAPVAQNGTAGDPAAPGDAPPDTAPTGAPATPPVTPATPAAQKVNRRCGKR